MSVHRQTGRRPPDLDGIDPPVLLEHVWEWFREISAGRQFIDGRPLPISNLELFAWSQLNGIKFTPFELRCIRTIDACYINPKPPEDWKNGR